ncbi:MAG: polysaccharide biosynthesis protein [Acidaminococcaceae bacterium]|nr:polysaccharide biosynthesis protein [Acidaminococcaceae bacterium]
MRRYMLPIILILTDVISLCISVWLAMTVRFAGTGTSVQAYIYNMIMVMPIYLIIHILCFYIFKLYHRVWKYAGIKEMVSIVASNLCGMILFTLVLWLISSQASAATAGGTAASEAMLGALTPSGSVIPRSVLILTLFFNIFLVAASRLFVRWAEYQVEKTDKENDTVFKRVLIVGAGDAGNIILRDLRQRDHRKVVGFIDDDPAKQKQIMNGVPVLGTRKDIESIAYEKGVREIIIAIPSMEIVELNELAELCSNAGPDVTVKILPSFFTTMDEASVNYQNLRPLQIEDLLNRDPVKLDKATFGKYLEGKTVLVTGAGGSIGSEICRQVLRHNPRQLILLGRGEGSIYEINRELQAQAEYKVQVVPYIMNIANKEGMEAAFEKFRPQIVFHAAAHKHVPLMEYQPQEAVLNNVVGFHNTADPAGRYGVERFVLISTDKAVNPTNVMGATKRLTEKLGQMMNKKYPGTKYMAVRFGNVLGSRGSVVPLFKKQIEAGGPLTVTHPDITRYFMTIPEASQLVIEAGSLGNGGEVFVLEMGKPVKIVDLAKNMIKLSGYVPGKDIKIEFTGLRPGEKMFEELMTAEEGTEATTHAKIHRAILGDEDPQVLKQQYETLITLQDPDAIIAQMREMIPTYSPNHNI